MKSFIFLFILFSSCTATKQMEHISFSYAEGSKRNKIIMNIPQGSTLAKVSAGGEGEEHRYWYGDSSLIYISDLTGSETLNESLIRKQEGAYNKRFMADTASFWGVDENGKYWKEVKHGRIFYGYANIPLSKKGSFDKALNTVKYK